MPWRMMDVRDQRVQFVVSAERQLKPFRALCAEFDISRPTGYEWLGRYRQQGLSGIAEQSRRPHHSPERTAEQVESKVVELMLRHPDWGAGKLSVLLGREGIRMPKSTVHRVLLRHDRVHAQARHSQARQRFERDRPNELWQMDFKGPRGWRHPVGSLEVIDDHSHYLIALSATGSTHASRDVL